MIPALPPDVVEEAMEEERAETAAR